MSDVHNYLFFETTATIITLVLLGNVLEHKSVQKTTTAIRDLAAIQKVTAKRKKSGKLEEIPFEKIELNDILIINTGDKIPTDGIIISGDCLIDESMVTGESIPVSKKSTTFLGVFLGFPLCTSTMIPVHHSINDHSTWGSFITIFS